MAVHVICAWAVFLLVGAQSPFDTLRAQADAQTLARIRAALQKPAPKLVIVVPKTDFRVNIEAIRPFADLFELPPWVTPGQDHVAPHISGNGRVAQFGSIDPGVVANSILTGVRTRRAHTEVVQALVEYCNAHRDEPGAAGICGGPPR